jgi:hypothetical protein
MFELKMMKRMTKVDVNDDSAKGKRVDLAFYLATQTSRESSFVSS